MDTSNLTTKTELKAEILKLEKKIDKVEKRLEGKIYKIEKRLNEVEKQLNEKIDKVEERLSEKLDKIMNVLDGFVGRVDDLSVDNEIGTHNTRELQLKVADLEKRVKKIESAKQYQ